ncbi:MAG TPA: hypothetical protein VEG28_01690 [Dehalococcoidia bacterium]|nr:hypothetical protein [Dehalococcoidia bacterium]
MDQSKKTLTQAEIDAMLSKGPQAQAAMPKAARTGSPGGIAQEPRKMAEPTQSAHKEARIEPVTSIADESLRATIAALAQRVAQIELDIGRLCQLERALADWDAASEPNARAIRSLAKKLQDLSTEVEGIVQSLLGTPAYGARRNFRCNHCGSQGTVATVLRCTQCGKDSLWGWWPKK